MHTLIFLVMFGVITITGCGKDPQATALAQPAPAVAAPPAAPTPSKNLAERFVLSESPEAKCEVFYTGEGQLVTHAVKCTLPDKRRIWASVDTANGPTIKRIDPPTEAEIQAAKQAEAAQAQSTKKTK